MNYQNWLERITTDWIGGSANSIYRYALDTPVTSVYQYQNPVTATTYYNVLMGGYQQAHPSSMFYIPQQWPWDETVEQKAEREKQKLERLAAEKRAEKLLFTILKPSQVKQYTDDGYFEQDINGRIYRLHKRSRSMNVELIEAGKPTIKFCAHPSDQSIPVPDVLLSQLLMLRSNEVGFLRIANKITFESARE